MPVTSIKIDSVWKKACLLLAAAACVGFAWFFARWGMANSAASRAEDAEIALYLTQLGPSDPQTHYAASVLLEKSFDPANIERSLVELETATALSPHNYLLWLDLGRARERAGESESAERALRRALELAPNYSRVHWALGNALLRQGRTEEAFVEIRKAVDAEPDLARSAAASAWQFFGGDVAAIRNAVGEGSQLDLALIGLLVTQKRFDEALALWDSLSPAQKQMAVKEPGATLQSELMNAKQFRHAARIANDIGEPARAGEILNGGFESAVRPEGAGPFQWQIGGGLQPQIVLSAAQKKSGANSLMLVFNSTSGSDFRNVSQVVAIEPNAEYEFEVYYRADLRSMAVFRWEVVDAVEGKQLAITDPTADRSDWTQLKTRFRMPATGDGIIVRLAREGCGQVCNVSGNLWFDDVTLRRVSR